MNALSRHLSMKHLMLLSIVIVALGVAWMLIVWMTGIDIIWFVPGAFLCVSGIIKIVAVQAWIRLAKLGTDDHRPIKAI